MTTLTFTDLKRRDPEFVKIMTDWMAQEIY